MVIMCKMGESYDVAQSMHSQYSHPKSLTESRNRTTTIFHMSHNHSSESLTTMKTTNVAESNQRKLLTLSGGPPKPCPIFTPLVSFKDIASHYPPKLLPRRNLQCYFHDVARTTKDNHSIFNPTHVTEYLGT